MFVDKLGRTFHKDIEFVLFDTSNKYRHRHISRLELVNPQNLKPATIYLNLLKHPRLLAAKYLSSTSLKHLQINLVPTVATPIQFDQHVAR